MNDLASLESYHRYFLMRMLLPNRFATPEFRALLEQEADRLAAIIIEKRAAVGD